MLYILAWIIFILLLGCGILFTYIALLLNSRKDEEENNKLK